jgi:hypothetical protein
MYEPTIIEQSSTDKAVEAMQKLHSLCLGFSTGSPPDGYSVLGVVNDLVLLRGKIGSEKARKFGGKERKKLTRRIAEAKHHRSLRNEKKTMAECDKEALLAVEEELTYEINAMEEWEDTETLLQSIDSAVRFGISAASAVRENEKRPSHNQ